MGKSVFVEVMPISTSVQSLFIMEKSPLSAELMAFATCFSADAIFHAFIARITR